MIPFARLRSAAVLCVSLCAVSFADKGDVFLSLSPAVEPLRHGEPAFGAGGGVSLGVNRQTDFQLEVDWTANPGVFDKDGGMATRYLLVSYFTPYFGEIRPRFGGSAGLVHFHDVPGGDNVYLDLGLHLQALYQAGDALRLFAEAAPNLSFGARGGLSTVLKLGLQFRLSK